MTSARLTRSPALGNRCQWAGPSATGPPTDVRQGRPVRTVAGLPCTDADAAADEDGVCAAWSPADEDEVEGWVGRCAAAWAGWCRARA